jgi:response regulator RpfG family c-di-GMP phosphodiesterase
MIEEAMAAFIKEVGVPVAAFVMMYALYVQNQKWQQKQQEKTEARLDNLVARFITTVKEIMDSQNKSREKHTAALERNTSKLEEHVRLKDEFMEYIKEGQKYHG